MKFTVFASIRLHDPQRRQAKAAVNMAVVGHEDCNEYSPGKDGLIPRPATKKQIQTLLGAHRNIDMNIGVPIEVTLDPETGNLSYTMPPYMAEASNLHYDTDKTVYLDEFPDELPDEG